MDRKLAALKELIEIVDRLRSPGGCPWDQEQTLDDMGRHLLEEVSEVVDAIEDSRGAPSTHIREELGDVLMNVVLAARIAEETDSFSLADVGEEISAKLIRRHPHVFGDVEVKDADEVLKNWIAIKASERESTDKDGNSVVKSRLDGIPRSLPTLLRAFEIGRKAAKGGFDWPDAWGAYRKISEELEEVRGVLDVEPVRRSETANRDDLNGEDVNGKETGDALEGELGDLLFAVVNLCRKTDVDPEKALRRTIRKFYRRFRAIEERFPDLENQSLEELEAVWQRAKSNS